MTLREKEVMETTKFKDEEKNVDIRLRSTEKKHELVCKKGFATDHMRKEITANLNSKKELEEIKEILTMLEIKQEPSWTTKREEYEYTYKNEKYSASLQDIERFAKILEIEHLGKKEEKEKHIQNIREIFEKLGLKSINKEEFKEKIKEYVLNNNK